jgi:hypothetical protein
MRKSLSLAAAALAVAAALLPSLALAVAADIKPAYLTAIATTDKQGKLTGITAFAPVLTVAESDRTHVTFRWETLVSCGTIDTTDYLVAGDERTPRTLNWDRKSCAGVPVKAQIGLIVLYDAAPVAYCAYDGDGTKPTGDACVTGDKAAALAKEAEAQAAAPKAPEAPPPAPVTPPPVPKAPTPPPASGMGYVPYAVAGGLLVLILLIVLIGRRKKKPEDEAKPQA